jgi:UDP-N-acetylmuramate--alanine ligase
VATLAPDFADAFQGADIVAVTDVYSAGEMARPGVSGKLVLDAIIASHPSARAVYVPNRDDLVTYLRTVLRPGDLCLTLAAGDLTNLVGEIRGEGGR